MSVVERFERFFAAANEGADPYPWQKALVAHVAELGEWPQAITAPTGSGKSSAVDVHVFLVAERARVARETATEVARPPRRLVLVAPRRVLVDDQYERAIRLAALLAEKEGEDGILGEVAASLRALVMTEEEGTESPLGVARLRGGVNLDHSWRLDPARCQIVCATPQMWGSRLLLRGFRGSRRSRNLEAGLLGHDAVVVIDEAHLHRRLVETSRKVTSLSPTAMGLQVVAMSATPTEGPGHTLTAKDFEDPELSRRVRAAKTVELVEVDDYKRDIRATAAARARELHGDGTVGVFVNTVETALGVAAELGKDGTVVLVCGRMRPADLARIRAEHEGLLSPHGNLGVDYLVSTQSLEVGVDLDLPAIVSEIAPASALAQRAGRLNRSGSRDHATFCVICPSGLATADPDALGQMFSPYPAKEIVDAARWLEQLGGDASPERISAVALPEADQLPVPALARVDLETLAMTGEVLAADPDPSFFVEEPRDTEVRAVSIGAREHLPRPGEDGFPDEVVRRMLLAVPPRAHELATMRIGKGLDAVLAAAPGSWVMRTDAGVPVAEPLPNTATLRDGDVVVLPAGSKVLTGRVIGRTGTAIDDVMTLRDPQEGEHDEVVRLPAPAVIEAIAEDPALGRRETRRILGEIALRAGHARVAERLHRHRRLADLELTWCAEDEGEEGLLALRATDREGSIPSATVGSGLVTVDAHGASVERRMGRILDALDVVDLGADRSQLLAAARVHDEGKRHPRFQNRMGATPETHPEPLAKPVPGYVADRGDGWRHEQLSAAIASATHDRDPVVIVATAAHHGHGRPLFDRNHLEVLEGWADHDPRVADELAWLFGPHGRYEALRADLQRALGVHRLAYLEALLRCADMQVSREGS